MEKKTLGILLLVLGGIFLFISLMTIWTQVGYYLIFAVPLLVFSIYTLYFGFYLIEKEKLSQKVKGFFLLIDGIIPILISVYVLVDPRFFSLSIIRNMALIPLFLVGIFLITYGVFLMIADRIISTKTTKHRVNKILGLISILIGSLNTAFFIIIVSLNPTQPIILLISLLLIGVVLVIFGVHLIIKKFE